MLSRSCTLSTARCSLRTSHGAIFLSVTNGGTFKDAEGENCFSLDAGAHTRFSELHDHRGDATDEKGERVLEHAPGDGFGRQKSSLADRSRDIDVRPVAGFKHTRAIASRLDDALFFARIDGGPLSMVNISSQWAKFATNIGMGEITFHALRHTHASHLIAVGVDVATVSKRLGHATPAITLSVYTHMFKQDDGKAAAAINAMKW